MVKRSEIAERALKNLAPETWHQGAYTGKEGQFCFLGHLGNALAELSGVSYESYDPQGSVEMFFTDVWAKESQDMGGDIAGFNDDPTTTYEDVRLQMKHLVEWSHEHDGEVPLEII